ncbi:MAG: prolipoprotein diacylglyceryl transferase [Lactobacillus sp.]|jgi:phosphatidylglycerol:prolipoprotein diacylglycerol transferase|uniref:Phosphatidylglycerol--prolipoprotein diacylglyceryl transferase n=1 Tax=Lacticaseibacillus suilingensis TaxID=2799577 RepID=A0ABW4BE32_9LACO|nr:prolipoprotein diacylglyceryl transferase [Lacticaseibacillus suilingensis]MCI1893577.1 prolipoprotein diacylglyceryl transferase [Lactobacillus sp.]MCI1917268.1 prolipoprotein diacylglyceryl transferase [Lactobacillus sp.]MCI1941209.1 prolipoprotein diacylglyceryl transferase [Lactobacillus sp.]MCI1971753.1 prolipoprotein diacylglyceryl transferase [Lactobacillus sp.]MCI2016193.1 prolipoprotein diacylglyceryl transferase [Lactobacillus sp.]
MLAALNPIALKLGGLEIHWYGVIIACGVLLAVWLATREANARGIGEDHIINLVLWALPFALIGARLYYVAFEWPYYAAHPDQIIAIWNGGIAIYGALIASVIVFLIYCRIKWLPAWLVLDIAAPTVMIAQSIGRWGNFMNQEAFGAKTTLAYLRGLHLPEFIIQQMNINGAFRQPTFLYESMWNLVGFVLIMSVRHHQGWFKRGEIVLSYVMWYSFGRFFVEGMRTDSLYMLPGLRVSQLLSIVLFVGALGLFIWRRRKQDLPWYMDGYTINNL